MVFLTWIGGALWPESLTREQRRRPAWRWFVHLVFLGTVTALLAYVTHILDLELALQSPWPALHRLWLPCLFLLMYAALWPLFWLAKLLASDGRAGRFPDIDDAWTEGLATLRAARISLRDTPVYLVLGRPAGSERRLFQAAGMQLVVPEAPERKESPLHIHAHRQGIYITSAGASLLGRQASHLQEAAINHHDAEETQRETDEEAHVGSHEMMELYAARLHHLCRLIAQARSPYCPIHGILVLVPLAATNDAREAQQTARLCQADLQVAREGLRVDCPIYVMVCDLEKSPGFGELVEALAGRRQQALACRFPLVPDLAASEVPGLVADGIKWLLQAHLPTRVYPCLRLESDKKADRGAGNQWLIRFLAQMHGRANRLARLVTRSLYSQERRPMLGGVYLAGTGADPQRGQGFAAEAFQDLARTANFVSWVPDALAEESHYRRLSRAVVAVAALLSAMLITGNLIR